MDKKKKRRKKKGYGRMIVSGFLMVFGIIAVISVVNGSLQGLAKCAVEKKVAQEVMEQALEKALEFQGDSQAAAKAKEIVEHMEEADKQKAEEIIGKYADSETLSDCMEILGDGINEDSLGEIREYLEESVSKEDQAQLEELYRKYSGGF